MPGITQISAVAGADKSLAWVARPGRLVYGEHEVTALTITYPTAVNDWIKKVEIETAEEVPYEVDGVTEMTTKVTLPYTAGMLLPNTLIAGNMLYLWAVAVGPNGETFKTLSLEMPLLAHGITPLAGVVEPVDTIETAEVDETGHLIFTKLDGTELDAGSVIGPQGTSIVSAEITDGNLTLTLSDASTLGPFAVRGPQGHSIASAAVDGEGNLTLTLDDEAGTVLGPWNIKGPKGDKGDIGNTGTTAYQAAVAGGYTGTEAEFNTLFAGLGDISAALDAIVG